MTMSGCRALIPLRLPYPKMIWRRLTSVGCSRGQYAAQLTRCAYGGLSWGSYLASVSDCDITNFTRTSAAQVWVERRFRLLSRCHPLHTSMLNFWIPCRSSNRSDPWAVAATRFGISLCTYSSRV